MAIDPRLALAGQPVDIQSAIAGGLANRRTARESGIRERILGQQEAAGAQSLEQNRRAQALQTADFTVKLFEGLKGVPLDQRAAIVSQQLPQLESMGIPAQEILATDLTDQGINRGLAALKPLVQRQQQQLPASAQEFNLLTEGLSEEDRTKAQRVKLGLDPRAVTSAPKVEEIGGVKYLRVGTQFFNPTTFAPAPTDPGTGLPVGAPEGAVPEDVTEEETPDILTPEAQRESQAATAAAVTKAKEEVKRDIRAEDPEVIEQSRKANVMSTDTIRVLDQLLVSDRLDDVTGVKGSLFTVRPKTRDLLNSATQLSSLLTQDNLDIMSGVLSETDIGIIRGISNDLGFEFNDKGDVTGFSGSFDGTVKKMKRIKNTIISGMNANGVYIEGQTAVGGSGQTITFTGGQWVDANGNPVQ